jgi:hypothetical protein
MVYPILGVVAAGPSLDVALDVGALECGACPRDAGGVVVLSLVHGNKSLLLSFIVMSDPILIIGWVKIDKLRVDFLNGTGQVHNLATGRELKVPLDWDNLHPVTGVDRGNIVNENQYESIWLFREKGHMHGLHHTRG